jgi:hypothetical protein
MAPPDVSNFTLIPESGTSSDSHYTALPVNGAGSGRPNGKKPLDLSKLSNLVLGLGVLAVAGSIGFVVSQTTTSTNTRANFDSSLVTSSQVGGVQPGRIAALTTNQDRYPTTYKEKAIDAKFAQQGEEKYKDLPDAERRAKVTNVLILYYAFADIIAENGMEAIGSDTSFDTMEQAVGSMYVEVRGKLVHQADYAYIKADMIPAAIAAEGETQRDNAALALEKIQQYRTRLQANPSGYQAVLDEANTDPVLSLLNNYERNEYVTNYVDDDNNVLGHYPLIFDEEFDDKLFTLQQGQVSEIIVLNSLNPYRYVVVYPTRIEKKKYQSIEDAVKERLSLFAF